MRGKLRKNLDGISSLPSRGSLRSANFDELESPDIPLSPLSPSATPGWGNWLSRVASTAYDTVVGAPESYEALEPSTELEEGAGTVVSSQFGDVGHEEKQALWRQLASAIGRDLMNLRMSLPIWIFEPTTTLVRMAESFEFAELLDSAASNDDPVLRDSLVAAFVISSFSGSQRVRKPFNPLLGETFEFISPVNGMKFYAEQVSHHPPLSVGYCEGRKWKASEVVDIKATFYGNAVEVHNVGTRYIELTKTGDRYSWNLPKTLAANLFIGGAFLDHYGVIELKNETTGSMSSLELTKCGWFSAGRYEVNGTLMDKDKKEIGTYKGAWNKILECEMHGKGRGKNRLWMAGQHMLSKEEGGGDLGTFANCTQFTRLLLHQHDDFTEDIPITDSRLRPDRLALAAGQKSKAAELKLEVEQKQRLRKQARIENGETYKPRWFVRDSGAEMKWRPVGDYWEKVREEDLPQLW